MPDKLFISYARADDEPFVRRLYQDLTEFGYDVWWDREAMESRGRTFLQEIRDAIIAGGVESGAGESYDRLAELLRSL